MAKGDGAIRSAKGKRNKENARALVKFEDQHPRREIAYALQLSGEQAMITLGEALTDEAFKRVTLATLARNHGISFKRIAQCFFETKVDEGKIRMAPIVPQMMEDIAKDALSTQKQCPVCDGTGLRQYRTGDDADEQPAPEACKECNGTGLVRVVGDATARKMVMESAGLVGKGVNVDARVQTVNMMSDDLEGTLALVKKVREVQRDVVQRPVVDVEVNDGDV